MPRFLKIKEWIDSGVIGDVRNVRAVQHQSPAQEDLSRATLPWRPARDFGRRKVLDMGFTSSTSSTFCSEPSKKWYGIASNQGGLYDVEDTVTATWRHAGGVQGYGSWCYVCGHDGGEDYVEIVGSKGRIEFELFSPTNRSLIRGSEVAEADIPQSATCAATVHPEYCR